MYTALYRTERPEVFSEVIGQEHIVKILKHQIETGTTSHAYLFCGTRGTGKTTTARILAKAVNCLADGERPCGCCENCKAIKEGNFIDVIEIDAASNNGVDNIRELRESVKYPPAVGRKKVYIIDEVHMLTPGAANALLKTLEEPPENIMFILATTDPQKLPQTILSRCMRLDFKRVPEKYLIDHMKRICNDRGVEVTESAVRLLAANADGSVRDGLSILDQCLSGGDKVLDRDLILEFLGTVSEDFFIELTERVALHDVPGALLKIDEAVEEGKDIKQLMKDWMSHYRNLLITKYIKNAEDMLNMSSENIQKLKEQGERISLPEINNGILTLSRTINDARYSTQPRILLELAAVTIAEGISEMPMQVQQTAVPKMAVRQQAVAQKKVAPAAKTVAANAGGSEENRSEAPAGEEAPATCACDPDALWCRIIEECEKTQGSVNILRDMAVVTEVRGNELFVEASSEFYFSYIERYRKSILDSASVIMGHPVKMKVEIAGEQAAKTTESEEMNELANNIENKYDIDIKVE